MQRSGMMLARPFLTLMASVGHFFMHVVQPTHFSGSRRTECGAVADSKLIA
jgi:hypothetical protein